MRRLPGIGRKSAEVTANFAFHEPVIAVDTHVFRVSNRIPLAPGATVDAVADGLARTKCRSASRTAPMSGCSGTGATSARPGSRPVSAARSPSSALWPGKAV